MNRPVSTMALLLVSLLTGAMVVSAEPVDPDAAVWAGGLALAAAAGAVAQEDPLRCLQKPMFWMVGEHNRILIETPADCPPRIGRIKGVLPLPGEGIWLC